MFKGLLLGLIIALSENGVSVPVTQNDFKGIDINPYIYYGKVVDKTAHTLTIDIDGVLEDWYIDEITTNYFINQNLLIVGDRLIEIK